MTRYPQIRTWAILRDVPRAVALLAYDGAQSLDITGPAEVFAVANQMSADRPYRIVVVSSDGGGVVSSSGLALGVESSLDGYTDPIDTLVVPGAPDWSRAMRDDSLVAAVAAGAERSRRVAAVCGGAFLLGRAGLLTGRRATTHWMCLDDLEECFPEARVERGPIFTQDGPVYTSAGVTAGIDLALALVESDHGPRLAREVARFLVVFMQRPGGQEQFSARMRVDPPVRSSIRDLLDHVVEDPAADHSLTALSTRAGFSERHLTRLFLREIGISPSRYVEGVRIEAARSLLETGDASVDVIARRSGMGSAETLRRRFVRTLGVSPDAYRRRFRTTGVAPVQVV
jgi:transcriptional regulator GlxA family with amidase domain